MEVKVLENSVIVSDKCGDFVINDIIHATMASMQEGGCYQIDSFSDAINRCVSKLVEYGHNGDIPKEEALSLSYSLTTIRANLENLKI